MLEERRITYPDSIEPCPRHDDRRSYQYSSSEHRIRQDIEQYSHLVATRRKGIGRHYIRPVDFERRMQARLFYRLSRVANSGDTRAFSNTVQKIKWDQRSANDFVTAIKLALKVSSPSSAQSVFDKGIKRHPNSSGLKSYSLLFARGTARPLSSNPTLRANREWLKQHRTEFRGQWIALQNGELLASGSLEEVSKAVTNRTNVLLTRA